MVKRIICNDVPGHWLDMWSAWWLYSCITVFSEPKKQVILWSVFVIGSTFTYFRFSRPFPTLVWQATNTGVRRPGYEANICMQLHVPRMPTCILYWKCYKLTHISPSPAPNIRIPCKAALMTFVSRPISANDHTILCKRSNLLIVTELQHACRVLPELAGTSEA